MRDQLHAARTWQVGIVQQKLEQAVVSSRGSVTAKAKAGGHGSSSRSDRHPPPLLAQPSCEAAGLSVHREDQQIGRGAAVATLRKQSAYRRGGQASSLVVAAARRVARGVCVREGRTERNGVDYSREERGEREKAREAVRRGREATIAKLATTKGGGVEETGPVFATRRALPAGYCNAPYHAGRRQTSPRNISSAAGQHCIRQGCIRQYPLEVAGV